MVLETGTYCATNCCRLAGPPLDAQAPTGPGAGSVSTQETPPSPYRSLGTWSAKTAAISGDRSRATYRNTERGSRRAEALRPSPPFPAPFSSTSRRLSRGAASLQANGDLPHANVRGSWSHNGRHFAPSRPRQHRVFAARMYARQAPCASVIFIAPVLPGKPHCLASPDTGGRVTRQASHAGREARGAGRREYRSGPDRLGCGFASRMSQGAVLAA